ncbi:hypothetical protein A2U01_0053213 [Trifolium medium]|uniref:Reverse transcriptase zinc-binding domain-containing protein n=1 Tax=Trifolium medium TaxID=97028 RepID=A0A392R5X9_9FABA|nr:hypothetical protein [Trifolium medium]
MSIGQAWCDYCGDVEETIIHAMRDCPLVMSLWLNVLRWKDFWAVACHSLWYWHNKETPNPPKQGWIRLNSDDASKDGKQVGCGGVIRGSDGE